MKCFREGILKVTVNTNNGVERKNKDFKYEFLSQHRNNTLIGMVVVLVEQFLPEIYSRYLVLVTFEMYFFYNYNKKVGMHDSLLLLIRNTTKIISFILMVSVLGITKQLYFSYFFVGFCFILVS